MRKEEREIYKNSVKKENEIEEKVDEWIWLFNC